MNIEHLKKEVYMNDHERLNIEWKKSQENQLLRGMKVGREFSYLVEELPGFKESFHALDTVCCSDGRVRSGAKAGVPGQGILLKGKDLEIYKEWLRRKRPKLVGHENCGAAHIAHPNGDSDQHGYDFTKNLAHEEGLPYEEIHKDQFLCPVHNERCLVLDGSERFDVANMESFPPQYTSIAAAIGFSEEYQMDEIKALVGIALGDHAFGDKFTKDDPFYIFIAAVDDIQLTRMEDMVRKVLPQYEGRVKMASFVVPPEEK